MNSDVYDEVINVIEKGLRSSLGSKSIEEKAMNFQTIINTVLGICIGAKASEKNKDKE
jgi:hypothetical protein